MVFWALTVPENQPRSWMLCGLLEPTLGSGKVLDLILPKIVKPWNKKLAICRKNSAFTMIFPLLKTWDFMVVFIVFPQSRWKNALVKCLRCQVSKKRQQELVANLSGGWKQRLALACSILHNPSILFLDEPTGGVDPVSRRMFWEIIYNLSLQGTTVMVTTHFMDEAEHCDEIGFIFEGNLIGSDTPDNLKKLFRVLW